MSIRKRVFPAATGKMNFEIQRLSGQRISTEKKAIFVITRKEIEGHDISHLLGTLCPTSDAEQIRKLQGRVVFVVSGYDDAPEPLCTIPAVRAFFAQCHRWWQGWSFFGDLESECLAMIACSLVPNVAAIHQPDLDRLEVTVHQQDLISFFESCLPAAAFLHSRVGIGKMAGMKLLQGVSFYLDLPER